MRRHIKLPTYRIAFPIFVGLSLAISALDSLAEVPEYTPAADRDEAVRRIEELGGSVRFVSSKNDALEVDMQFAAEGFNDTHLQYLSALKNIEVLRLKRTSISDAGLVHLKNINTLKRLYLEETAVTDNGIDHLSTLVNLETLNLYGTAITDAALENLSMLTNL
ncbi:MAG: hypothetical protein ACI9G1_004748, partial [Pirellulaceae bacterium]